MPRTVEETSRKRQPTTELLSLFPYQGQWTEAAYFSLPETNHIVELSEGMLVITPAPTEQHQRISARLFLLIGNYVMSEDIGQVRYAPLSVRLWKDKIREPDIVFMSKEHIERITERCWGVPDLAMEILSEGTARDDRTDKFYEYAKAGVLEYWIVDPSKQSIEVFSLEKGAFELFGKWQTDEIAESKLLSGFSVSVNEIML